MTSPYSIGFGSAGPARRDAMAVAHEGILLAKTADVHAAAAQARADDAHTLATTGNTTADAALALAGDKAQLVAFNTTLTSSPKSDVEQLLGGLSITASLKAGRFYLFVGFGFEAQTDTGDNLLMRLRHTTDGTAVTLTSTPAEGESVLAHADRLRQRPDLPAPLPRAHDSPHPQGSADHRAHQRRHTGPSVQRSRRRPHVA